jgi:hypothetical protein
MATNTYIPKYQGKNTAEMQGPKAADVTMPATGDFTREDVPDIEVVADVEMVNKDWAEQMAYLEGTIKIRLHPSNDPNVEPRVPVCVNGEKAHPVWGNHLPRGIELVVKRKVAGVIAAAKPMNVVTVRDRDHTGNDVARIVRNIGFSYPFELINGTQRDQKWLETIRAQA